MSVVLCLLSLGLLCLFVIFVNQDFANPGFIYLSTWTVSCFAAIFILKGSDISFVTLLIILCGNTIFILGVCFSQYLIKTGGREKQMETSFFPVWLNILFLLLAIYLAYFVYRDLVRVSSLVEPSREFNKVLEGARYASTRSIGRITYLSATFLRFLYALGIVEFYYFCKELFYPTRGFINRLLLLAGSMLLLVCSILSAGRSELLGMISAYLFIFLIFYSKKYAWEKREYRMKVLRIITYTGVLFFLIFLFVGVFLLNRTGASQGEDIFSNSLKYIGSSVAGFDYYIKNKYLYSNPVYLGQNTFLALYSTLTSLGMYNGPREVFLPYVNISGTITNVYTTYYYFIQDFGYFFGISIQFLYGIIFGSFYYRIKKQSFSRTNVVIYSLISQAIIMSFFAEQFFSVLSNHVIRIVFALFVLQIISLASRLRISKKV